MIMESDLSTTKSQQCNATVCMNQHQNGNQIGDHKQLLRLPFYNMTSKSFFEAF